MTTQNDTPFIQRLRNTQERPRPRSGDVIHPQLLGIGVWVRDYTRLIAGNPLVIRGGSRNLGRGGGGGGGGGGGHRKGGGGGCGRGMCPLPREARKL